MPSTRNITRQPERPNSPCQCWMISVETTEPSAVEIGMAVMNNAVIRARCDAGNQYVRYRMMPGKKPASATPSRNRSTMSTVRVRGEGHRGGDDAPGHEDAGDPTARAEAVQHEVARHLEQQVADEEHARRDAEQRGREPQLLVHAVGPGEPDVHPVQVVDEVHQHQQGDEALARPAHPRADQLFFGADHGVGRHGGSSRDAVPDSLGVLCDTRAPLRATGGRVSARRCRRGCAAPARPGRRRANRPPPPSAGRSWRPGCRCWRARRRRVGGRPSR